MIGRSFSIALICAAAATSPRFAFGQEAPAGSVRFYLDTPPGGPDWGVRFVVTLLYPK